MEIRWEDLETLFSKEGFQGDMEEVLRVGLETLGLLGVWEAQAMAQWVAMVALDLALGATLGDLGETVDLVEQGGILEVIRVDSGEETPPQLGEATGIIVDQDIRIEGIKDEDGVSFMIDIVVRILRNFKI